MNVRREAILWSITIISAIALGLIVVWAAIVLAFRRPNQVALYYSVAPYRQDDYSAESLDTPRLNPLDPNLEQEAILEDEARDALILDFNQLTLADQVSPSTTPAANIPVLTSTNLPVVISTSTSMPAPANTSVPPRPENSPQPTQPDKPGKPTQPPTPDKPDKPPKPTDAPKPPKPDKPPKSTEAPKPPKPDKPPDPPKPDKPDKPGKP
jgi:hypothetical protein